MSIEDGIWPRTSCTKRSCNSRYLLLHSAPCSLGAPSGVLAPESNNLELPCCWIKVWQIRHNRKKHGNERLTINFCTKCKEIQDQLTWVASKRCSRRLELRFPAMWTSFSGWGRITARGSTSPFAAHTLRNDCRGGKFTLLGVTMRTFVTGPVIQDFYQNLKKTISFDMVQKQNT
jgi:hypothetical protein